MTYHLDVAVGQMRRTAVIATATMLALLAASCSAPREVVLDAPEQASLVATPTSLPAASPTATVSPTPEATADSKPEPTVVPTPEPTSTPEPVSLGDVAPVAAAELAAVGKFELTIVALIDGGGVWTEVRLTTLHDEEAGEGLSELQRPAGGFDRTFFGVAFVESKLAVFDVSLLELPVSQGAIRTPSADEFEIAQSLDPRVLQSHAAEFVQALLPGLATQPGTQLGVLTRFELEVATEVAIQVLPVEMRKDLPLDQIDPALMPSTVPVNIVFEETHLSSLVVELDDLVPLLDVGPPDESLTLRLEIIRGDAAIQQLEWVYGAE